MIEIPFSYFFHYCYIFNLILKKHGPIITSNPKLLFFFSYTLDKKNSPFSHSSPYQTAPSCSITYKLHLLLPFLPSTTPIVFFSFLIIKNKIENIWAKISTHHHPFSTFIFPYHLPPYLTYYLSFRLPLIIFIDPPITSNSRYKFIIDLIIYNELDRS